MAEAIRQANAFVADRPDREDWRLRGAVPNSLIVSSQASKHPVAWLVMFAPIPPQGVDIEGGELFVAVDLESGSVGLHPH